MNSLVLTDMLSRLNRIVDTSAVKIVYLTLVLIVVSACVMPFESQYTQLISEFAVVHMIALLLFGLIFFILNQRQLMIWSMLSCAVLCIYLKDASNNNLLLPKIHSGPKLSTMHINVSSAARQYDQVYHLIESRDPDILSIQECTPDWFQYFEATLHKLYPYYTVIEQPISFATGIYSKYPISTIDTIMVDRISNLSVSIEAANHSEVQILNTYLMPQATGSSTRSAKDKLNVFTDHLDQIDRPVINLGDFNMTYWSRDILNYRLKNGLENSRRGVNVTRLEVPYDHIFFSREFECIGLQDLTIADEVHIGLMGTFQLRTMPEKKEDSYSSKLLRF